MVPNRATHRRCTTKTSNRIRSQTGDIQIFCRQNNQVIKSIRKKNMEVNISWKKLITFFAGLRTVLHD